MTSAAADHHTIRPRVMTDADHKLADLLRRHPDGLTIREIARLLGVTYDSVSSRLYRLEHRGLLLCEDRGRVSLYQEPSDALLAVTEEAMAPTD